MFSCTIASVCVLCAQFSLPSSVVACVPHGILLLMSSSNIKVSGFRSDKLLGVCCFAVWVILLISGGDTICLVTAGG